MTCNWRHYLLGLALLAGCGKDDGPKLPDQVVLTFPANNSVCITGTSVSPTTSEVVFTWQAAANAATYEISVTRIGSVLVERVVTSGLSAPIVIRKGAPFSWQVVARNSAGDAGPSSPTWQFYNAGASQTYPPFPARLLEPASGTTLVADANGDVTLRWSGADPDGDLSAFEVYFGVDANALTRVATLAAGVSTHTLGVSSDTVYYWEIISRDSEGNAAFSGVNSFRVL